MPSVAPKKRELYLGKCLDDLHKLTEINQLGNNVNVIVRSSKKVFQEAELHDSKGDEERSYVLYLKYFNIIKQIKQKAEYKKQKEYFDNLIGKNNQVKAITRAEDLSASLKERYDFREAEALAKKLATASSGSTAPEKKKNADVEPVPAQSENKPSADKSRLAEGCIDCTKLCTLLRDTTTKVIIMDVRGMEDFSQSHISHSDCINVPENIIKPGSTVSHIQSKLPQDSLETWQQRKYADFIVLLDWSSSLDQVIIGSPLRTLKDALYKFDMGTVIKSEPLVLEKGYENWLLFYPTMTTNAHVQMPNAKMNEHLPSPISLDFEYPELDDNLQKIVPAATNNAPLKTEDQRISQVSILDMPDKSIPRVDRSLKPSISNSQVGNGKALNNDSSPNNNMYPSFESIATKPVANTMGINTSYVPNNMGNKLDKDPKGFALSVKNELAKDNNTVNWKKTEPVSKEFPASRNHQLKEDKLRLEETEKKLRELELIKKAEERKVADLMRMKKKLTQEIDAEQKMKDTQALEEQKRVLELEKAKAEADKNQRLAEVERMRLERKKAELEKEIEKRLLEDQEEERQWQATQDAIRRQREEEQRQHVTTIQQDKEEQKSVAESETDQDINSEKESPVRDEETKRLQQQEEAAKQAIEAAKQAVEAEEARKMAEVKRQQEEAAKAEAERLRQEQLAQELEQKKKLMEQKKAEEAAAAQRAAKQKELEERKQQESGNKNVSWKTVPSNMLPPGWEKRLDQTTKRYFYIDHNRGVTQWSAPVMPDNPNSKDGTYTTSLKEEPSVSSSRGLSRSHSSPNIKKQLEEEEERNKKIMPLPSVNRGNKPVHPRAQNLIAKQTAHSLRKRELNPVYGNVGPALTGLRNLGNTCYMNSTIQCLNNTSPLITYILNDAYVSDVNRESSQGMYGEVVDDFAVVVKALWSQQYRSITPRDLKAVVAKYNPMFAGYQQQDSQEFLTFLLDGLHEGLNEVRRAPEIPEQNNDGIPDREAADIAWKHHKMLHRSIIVELFQGQLKSTLQCGTCSKTSVTFQAFMFLSLPIPSSSRCSLQDCIREFLKPEMMTGSSKWKCPRCKVERDSQKKIEIWKLPPILLVGLNRFYSEGMWMQKKSSYVDFPLNSLDLTQYISGSRTRNPYNLYGISNHYGTMEGGHYTAFCRNPVSKKWYKFDDQDVYEISSSDVKTSAAFVLYYTSIEMPAPRYVPRL